MYIFSLFYLLRSIHMIQVFSRENDLAPSLLDFYNINT